MERNTAEYEAAVKGLARSYDRVEEIRKDPERIRRLTYRSNGVARLTGVEFLAKYEVEPNQDA
jgi:hypothetical protein